MKPAKFLNVFIVFSGGFISLAGGILVCMYFWAAVISRMGDPDQSLIFWYLPLLLFGVIAIRGGLKIIILGKTRLKSVR